MGDKRKIVVFNGFSTRKKEKGWLVASSYRACDCRDGVLRRGVGVQPYLKGNGDNFLIGSSYNVLNIFRLHMNAGDGTAEREMTLIMQDNGILATVDDSGTVSSRSRISFPTSHHAVKTEKGEILHVFSSPKIVSVTKNFTNFTQCAYGNKLTCCVVGGRYFLGAEFRTVYYSSAHELDNYQFSSDGAGILYLPEGEGDILSLQTDGEYLYVFCKSEIYCVEVRASGMDFAIEKVEYDGGEICKDSMVQTSKGVVFLSVGGVYFLEGKKAKRICEHLAIRPVDPAYACQVGVCEELALIDYQTLNKSGARISKRVAISVEEDDGFFCERYGTLGGNDLCSIGGVVYQFAKDSTTAIYPYLPQFVTGELDFGTRARKYLKRLRVEGNGKIEVSIKGEGKTVKYALDLDNRSGDVRLAASGREFVLRIFPYVGAEVRSMEIEYTCMEDRNGY